MMQDICLRHLKTKHKLKLQQNTVMQSAAFGQNRILPKMTIFGQNRPFLADFSNF